MSDMLDRKLLEKLLDNEDLKLESESGSYLAVGVILRIREAIQSSALSPQDNTRQQEGWIPVSEREPDCRYFIALLENQGNIMLMAWHDPVHNQYLYTGGQYLGSPGNPHFTKWMPRPPLPSPPTKQEPPHDHT